ncbi:SPOR domain-containing protein [Mucilaginibacter aquatilis]|uniref:SPOR domain-containing protein n=1 Tax=Mucilaginibacter aquatilis TaxID=1517760 RepID=A0A6I4IGC6_9SPHI|nr:SPOR domain-containing protein [Mucilaginibacter aquatilis]MVN92596.1 SPOR domain-containing protein [Mucilaginibacter aquatilis]
MFSKRVKGVFTSVHNKFGIALATCIIACLFAFSAKAQNQQGERGKLEVIKDSRIDSLIAHRGNLSKGMVRGAGLSSSYGYRVQFFIGPNRKSAFDAQNRMQQMHPELRTYINYAEPNFKVKAGDFRTRLEASKLMQELRGTFTSLFIISEKINPPKLDANPNMQ